VFAEYKIDYTHILFFITRITLASTCTQTIYRYIHTHLHTCIHTYTLTPGPKSHAVSRRRPPAAVAVCRPVPVYPAFPDVYSRSRTADAVASWSNTVSVRGGNPPDARYVCMYVCMYESEHPPDVCMCVCMYVYM
jgi:hypothetical protein